MPSMVSMRHNVWQTRANIPYWRRVTTQMWVVFLIGHAVRQTSTSKRHYLNWVVISMEFPHSFLRRHFPGKPVVASQEDGSFLRLCLFLFLLSFAISANLNSPTLAINILFSFSLVSNSSTYLEVKTWLVTQPCFLATALITTNPVSPSTIPFLLL